MIYCACFSKAKIRLKAILSPNEKENRAITNGNVLSADSTNVILSLKERRKGTVLKSRDNRVSRTFDRCFSGKKMSLHVQRGDKNVASRTNLRLKGGSCFTIERKAMSGVNDRKQQQS